MPQILKIFNLLLASMMHQVGQQGGQKGRGILAWLLL